MSRVEIQLLSRNGVVINRFAITSEERLARDRVNNACSGQISHRTFFSIQRITLKYMYMMAMTAMVSAILFDIP